jgi:hypothetical protein
MPKNKLQLHSETITTASHQVITNISALLLPLCAEAGTSGQPLVLRILAVVIEQLISTCYSAELIAQIMGMKWTGPELETIAEIVKRAHARVLADVRVQFAMAEYGGLLCDNCGVVVKSCSNLLADHDKVRVMLPVPSMRESDTFADDQPTPANNE